MNNILITKAYMYESISETELLIFLNFIFDTMGVNHLPFLAANFCLNAIAIILVQHQSIFSELLVKYPVEALINNAFQSNIMGSGSLALQLEVLKSNHPEFCLHVQLPTRTSNISGLRSSFILRHGMNPTIFNAWL